MGILTEEIKEFVNRQKLAFVATVCADGTPNLSPKGTTIVWDDDHLAFADIYSPGTIKNLTLPLFSPIYDTGATEEEVKAMYIKYWSAFYPLT